MIIKLSSTAAIWLAISTLIFGAPVLAQAPAVDPAAIEVLKRMTDHLGATMRFSVHTQNTYEDELESGQRVDYDVSASVLLDRKGRLRSERTGELVDQAFYYDGENLTVSNRTVGVYATRAAPASLDGLLDYSREELGLHIPGSDLVYSYAYTLLTENVTSAVIVGQSDINGMICTHLAFSHPDVDYQVWVQDGEQPLPCKYVVTDTSTPSGYSVSTVMSNWNVAPDMKDSQFMFVSSDGANEVEFLPLDSGN